ncbi:hypothetical protein H0H93_003451 [Arthromyces matolae]|nr:hypothetical protein H0H93_003451 [Arthromyces matolae]
MPTLQLRIVSGTTIFELGFIIMRPVYMFHSRVRIFTGGHLNLDGGISLILRVDRLGSSINYLTIHSTPPPTTPSDSSLLPPPQHQNKPHHHRTLLSHKPCDFLPAIKVEKEKRIPSTVAADDTVPEKHKRDRPWKVSPLPAPSPPAAPQAVVDEAMKRDATDKRTSSQQYLLATFALFFFFNSPLTSSYSSSPAVHVHTDTLLSGSSAATSSGLGSGLYWLQLFHLLVSILVLLGFLSNWTAI